MQFRVQAKKLQFIRSVYNSTTKRCDQKLVGSISRYTNEMPSDDQIEMLTDKERHELSVYLANKKAETQKTMHWSAVYNADKTLSAIADGILSGEAVSDVQAAAIWRGVAAISKALKKSGHPKSKDTQMDLQLETSPVDPLPSPAPIDPSASSLLPSAVAPA